ncbi:MAG: hypothetical protein K8R57_10180 [Verrucomicrobia bacterium]|nr:hypothetical protein [Verrucomicrobiota bacterium]
MKKAIALISYCRDEYFQLVYPTLIHQKIFGKKVNDFYDIYIFQDGLAQDARPEVAREHRRLQNRIKRLHGADRIHIQEKNLGVARHFDYLEKLLFVEKAYDYVVFCEEDMILAPGYMQVMDLMGEQFWKDPRVGMVSAFRERRQHDQDYVAMGHNWGFGRWKEKWQESQNIVQEYLQIIGEVPYHKRNTPSVLEWIGNKGFRPLASSQDYIKQCSVLANKSVRISFGWNYGLPIGREGLHCRRQDFDKMGLDNIIISTTDVPERLPEFREETYRDLLERTQKEMMLPVK